VTHAVVLLLVVLVAAGPVGQIPLAALAGVLMVTAVRMVHLDTVRAILRSTRADAVAFVATAVITVSFDLIVAVVIGVAFAGFFALRGMSQASQVRREDVRGQTQPGDERIAILRFDGPLSFTSADRVSAEVDAVRGVGRHHADESAGTGRCDGAHMLGEITQTLERRGITVLIKGVQPRHEDLFRTVGVLAALRHHNHLFTDLPPPSHTPAATCRETTTA
jgi:SulP family sulfate permease